MLLFHFIHVHARPQFAYGHSLDKTLEQAGITADFGGKNVEGRSDLAQAQQASPEIPPPTGLLRTDLEVEGLSDSHEGPLVPRLRHPRKRSSGHILFDIYECCFGCF